MTDKIELRQPANIEILDNIKNLILKYPELRFGQILVLSGVIQYKQVSMDRIEIVDPFAEESVDTLNRVKGKIKMYDFDNSKKQ